MSQSQNDQYNPIELKQYIFIKKINVPLKEKTKIFPNKTNLRLTSAGFDAARTLSIEFTKLNFTEALTIKEIKHLCELSQSFFYINSSCNIVYTTDLNIVSLYNVFQGNKKALF